MGESTQKTTQTSGPSNPAVNSLLTSLSQGIQSSYQPGGTTYVAPSSTTAGGWQSALDAAGNPAFSGGLAGALQSYGNRAAGNELGTDDPLYAAQRSRLSDQVLNDINSRFNQSGLYGSDRNIRLAGEGLTSALGGLDTQQRTESYGRQAEAAGLLPKLFQGSLLPSSIQQAVGGAQDADAQAKALGGLNYQQLFTQMLGGLSGASPQTTTQTAPSPNLLQSLLGFGVAAL